MKVLTILTILALCLPGCDSVATLRATTDGACIASIQTADPNSNVQIKKTKDGDHVTCTIEFEVTK